MLHVECIILNRRFAISHVEDDGVLIQRRLTTSSRAITEQIRVRMVESSETWSVLRLPRDLDLHNFFRMIPTSKLFTLPAWGYPTQQKFR